MQIIIAILSFAVLMWTEPASAQKTYSVSVSRHNGVDDLPVDQVENILSDASKLLQKEPGHSDADDEDVACNVTFTLKPPMGSFASPHEPVLFDQSDIDTVQAVNSDPDTDIHVKVVDQILFCRGNANGFNGCSFPPAPRSIIVVHPKLLQGIGAHVLWAHEFGHLAGLDHRKDDNKALMKCGGVTNASVRVNRRECRCMLDWKGEKACKLSPIASFC